MKYIFSVNNDDVNAKVVIKLADDCKNGRQDFSITGTFWEVGEVRAQRNAIAVGCCHDLIGQHFPEFASFVALHGRDFQGAPTHPIENGLYFAQPGKHHAEETGPEPLAKYFNIPVYIAEKLCIAEDEEHFAYLIEENKVDEMWLSEAQAAIAKLEQLTGENFENKSIKSNFKRLEGDALKVMTDKIEAGYYAPEALMERKRAKRSQLISELVMGYRGEQAEGLESVNITAEVNVTLATLFPEKHGNWFYWHKDKTIKFNRGFSNKFKESEITAAMEAIRLIVPDVKRG